MLPPMPRPSQESFAPEETEFPLPVSQCSVIESLRTRREAGLPAVVSTRATLGRRPWFTLEITQQVITNSQRLAVAMPARPGSPVTRRTAQHADLSRLPRISYSV